MDSDPQGSGTGAPQPGPATRSRTAAEARRDQERQEAEQETQLRLAALLAGQEIGLEPLMLEDGEGDDEAADLEDPAGMSPPTSAGARPKVTPEEEVEGRRRDVLGESPQDPRPKVPDVKDDSALGAVGGREDDPQVHVPELPPKRPEMAGAVEPIQWEVPAPRLIPPEMRHPPLERAIPPPEPAVPGGLERMLGNLVQRLQEAERAPQELARQMAALREENRAQQRGQAEQHRQQLDRMAQQHARDLQEVLREAAKWKQAATHPMPVKAEPDHGQGDAPAFPSPAETMFAAAERGRPTRSVSPAAMSDSSRSTSSRSSRRRRRDKSTSSEDTLLDSESEGEEWVEEEETPSVPYLIPRNRSHKKGRREGAFFKEPKSVVRNKELRLQAFDGTSLRWEDWLYRFEVLAALRRYTNSDLSAHLLTLLKGEPLQLCKRVRCLGRPYTNVRNEVHGLITGARTRPAERSLWNEMKRQPKESVNVYLERLKDQACQVFQGLTDNETLFYDIVKDKFLESAWTNSTAATLVEVMKPRTWAELREAAGTVEGHMPASAKTTASVSAASGMDGETAANLPDVVAAVNPGSAPGRGQTGQASGRNDRERKPNRKDRADRRGKSSHRKEEKGESKERFRNKECRLCGQDTHWTAQCWSLDRAKELLKAAKEAESKEKPQGN